MTDWLALIVYLGYPICKQFPERSFLYQSYQMPVEARDVGIFVAFLFTLLFIYFAKLRLILGRGSLHVLVTSFVLCVPLAIDVATSYTGMRATTNDIRLATGILFGIGVGFIVSGWAQDIADPTFKPIEMKHMTFVLLAIPLLPLISYSSANTLAGFVMFSFLSVAGYMVFLFLGIRLLVLESEIGFFQKRKGTITFEMLVIGFEALLLLALAGAHYAGVLMS